MIFSRLYTLVLSVLVVIAALLFHINPDNFLADDAYFYPQIANQIVLGNGSTFHQYSFTNGYQPLWMIFNIIAAGIAGGNKIALLHILGFIQVVLFVVTLYYLLQITLTARIRFFSVGLAFLTILMLAVGGLRLFESHLAIALQMAACYLFLRFWQSKPSTDALAACSVLLGMIFLARTDAFFFSAAYGIALGLMILREPSRPAERAFRILATALPAVLIAAFYMTFNKVAFGHPVPISGVIKSSYPSVNVDWTALGLQGQYIVGVALLLLLASIPMAAKQKSLQALFGVAFAAIFLHAAYIICFSWGSQWHYTTAFTIIPIALPFILTGAWEHIKYKRVFSGIVCTATLAVLVGMVGIGYLKTQYNFSVSMLAAGKQSLVPNTGKSARLHLVDEINRSVEPGAGIAVFDTPGVLAYFTHARILPLDGLVNDRAYNDAIVKEGFPAYLKEQKINYFLAGVLPEGQEYRSSTLHSFRKGDEQFNTVYAPIQKVPAGTFAVQDGQIVFESPDPIPGTHMFKSVALWKIDR